MKKQIWQPIIGYENYHISCNGEVMNSHGRLLKAHADRRGYMAVTLCRDGITRSFRLHRLVAIAFIPNPEGKATVNHINGDKLDNRMENLEWTTQSENNRHAYNIGLSTPKGNVGEKNGRAKLSQVEVAFIRTLLTQKIPAIKIANRYGVHPTTISKIKRERNWK